MKWTLEPLIENEDGPAPCSGFCADPLSVGGQEFRQKCRQSCSSVSNKGLTSLEV